MKTNKEEKEFKEIPYLDGLYEISRDGTVRNTETQRILTAYSHNNGSPRVSVKEFGTWVSKALSRLLAITYLGMNPEDHVVYKDGSARNITLSNLSIRPCKRRLAMEELREIDRKREERERLKEELKNLF